MEKLLLLCPVYAPYPAGGAQSFPIVADTLSKSYQVIVLTEYHPHCSLVDGCKNLLIFRILFRRDTIGKKSYIYSAASFAINYFIIYMFVLASLFYGVEYYHFTRYTSPLSVPLLQLLRIFRRKLTYDCRTSASNISELKNLKHALPVYDLILCNSSSAFNIAHKFATRSIKLICNPLALKTVNNQDSVDIDYEYFVNIGTVCSRKASMFIVHQYNHFVSDYFDEFCRLYPTKSFPKLIIAGRNDIGPEFVKLVARSYYVEYIGEVSHSRSISLLRSSLGSVNISNSEGIPRSSLESLYFRKPCILPACVPEFVSACEHACYELKSIDNITPTNKSADFNSLLKDLLFAPNKLLSITQNYDIQFHSVEHFSIELLSAYSNL